MQDQKVAGKDRLIARGSNQREDPDDADASKALFFAQKEVAKKQVMQVEPRPPSVDARFDRHQPLSRVRKSQHSVMKKSNYKSDGLSQNSGNSISYSVFMTSKKPLMIDDAGAYLPASCRDLI
jgi:hypothetical protein